MNNGQKLWKRAKKIIPNGNMLLSKNSDSFLPNFWPSYFKKTKGCYVWCLDNKKYLDMSIMGIGTNILGYSNDYIDKAVIKVVQNGNLSTLNAPEEVFLAEKILELNPWAAMVKFTRSGGEANAVAIRIARAATNKQEIAICGYHGWHDWYLSANLKNKNNLDDHLFPNVMIKGVNSRLKNTVHPFKYNDIESLTSVLEKNKKIGIIKMEVMRNEFPKDNFLKKIEKIAIKNKLILIFDECTTGFRETDFGLHKKYNVTPDIAIFGKALGNGYAINSIIGKKDIMREAEQTFISSTFWSERIGYVAGLKTLELMQKEKSWEKITYIGKKIQKNIKLLAKENNIPVTVSGLPSLTSIKFKYNNLGCKTFLTQEMLKKGILASNLIYVCTKHDNRMLEKYFDNLNEIFKSIRNYDYGNDIDVLLNGPVCRPGMRKS